MMRLKTFLAALLVAALMSPAPLALAKSGSRGKSGSSSSKSKGSSSKSKKAKSDRPKTVHVKGYTKKDGTYVRPHTRSAPGSKGSGSSSGSASGSGGSVSESPGPAPVTSGESPASVPASPQASDSCSTCEPAKRDFMRQTEYPWGRVGHVVGYIVALQCGGADDPRNVQWLTIAAAAAKIKSEAACKQ